MGVALDSADGMRGRARALVLRHGWNATCFQTLETGYSYFFLDDAVVAYVDTGGAWVAAGAPICASDNLARALEDFVNAAKSAGRRACFFGVEDRLLRTSFALESTFIGEMPVWDPRRWHEVLQARRSLREQLRRARAKGVRIRAATHEELEAGPLREAISRLGSRWLDTRALAPMGFLVSLEPFTFPTDRQCFVAEVAGRLVGFAGVIPVPARGGWFVEDLVRDLDAPNGTGEALIDAVMTWAKDQQCEWLTLGLAPLSGEVSETLGWFRSRGRAFYDFEGLRTYKAKLAPREWRPIFMAFPAHQGAVLTMLDALAAFTRGGFVRFAAHSFVRGPRVVLFALLWLLIAWTAALCVLPIEPRLGPSAKWTYVGLNMVVAAGLLSVLRAPRFPRDLARLTTVLGMVAADAVATWLFAMALALTLSQGWTERALLLVACLGPTAATVVLFGARARRARAAHATPNLAQTSTHRTSPG